MAIPREQVQERLFQLISNLGITSGSYSVAWLGAHCRPSTCKILTLVPTIERWQTFTTSWQTMQFVLSLMGRITTLMHVMHMMMSSGSKITDEA